jgi:hypothetical protein
MNLRLLSLACLALLSASSLAAAAYVTPAMGGGQVGMGSAPMLHTDVGFDGTDLTATVDGSHGVPMLRPLTPPDAFDPAQPWSVLSGKAYNFQHAWNPAGFITLPAGTGIWIERLEHSAGLESYLRPPAAPAYAPVFGADGARWKWSGAMTHNVYAVLEPTESSYVARYRVYIGDAASGEPVAGYGSATVRWDWTATPVPEPTLLASLAAGVALLLRRRS